MPVRRKRQIAVSVLITVLAIQLFSSLGPTCESSLVKVYLMLKVALERNLKLIKFIIWVIDLKIGGVFVLSGRTVIFCSYWQNFISSLAVIFITKPDIDNKKIVLSINIQ